MLSMQTRTSRLSMSGTMLRSKSAAWWIEPYLYSLEQPESKPTAGRMPRGHCEYKRSPDQDWLKGLCWRMRSTGRKDGRQEDLQAVNGSMIMLKSENGAIFHRQLTTGSKCRYPGRWVGQPFRGQTGAEEVWWYSSRMRKVDHSSTLALQIKTVVF